MARGAEAYLQMWERAYGVQPDSCRNPNLRMSLAKARKLGKRMVRKHLTTDQVIAAVGQPYLRLDRQFTFCAQARKVRKDGTRTKKMVKVSVVVKLRADGTVRKVKYHR